MIRTVQISFELCKYYLNYSPNIQFNWIYNKNTTRTYLILFKDFRLIGKRIWNSYWQKCIYQCTRERGRKKKDKRWRIRERGRRVVSSSSRQSGFFCHAIDERSRTDDQRKWCNLAGRPRSPSPSSRSLGTFASSSSGETQCFTSVYSHKDLANLTHIRKPINSHFSFSFFFLFV